MDESGSHRSEPVSHDDGETIQFGGFPASWPLSEIHLPRMPRPLPRPRIPEHREAVVIALVMLVFGLVIGFFGGRVTAHPPGRNAASNSPLRAGAVIAGQFSTTTIGLTGARCATQAGKYLQIGIEITNETASTLTLGRVSPIFPIGGLRAISAGIGVCGALAQTSGLDPLTSLSPGATKWIVATVTVQVTCPEALPVWFKVSYASGQKSAAAVLDGFPDLGSVSYRHCK